MSSDDLRILAILLTKIPVDRKWTAAKRALWLDAFTKSLDMVVEVQA